MKTASACAEGAKTIVYLSDFMPTLGPAALFTQLRAGIALSAGRPIDLMVVDSGSCITELGRGANLDALIHSGAVASAAGVVIIEGPHRLAVHRRGRRRAVAELLGAGFALRDASGELRPGPDTVALAAAALERDAPGWPGPTAADSGPAPDRAPAADRAIEATPRLAEPRRTKRRVPSDRLREQDRAAPRRGDDHA